MTTSCRSRKPTRRRSPPSRASALRSARCCSRSPSVSSADHGVEGSRGARGLSLGLPAAFSRSTYPHSHGSISHSCALRNGGRPSPNPNLTLHWVPVFLDKGIGYRIMIRVRQNKIYRQRGGVCCNLVLTSGSLGTSFGGQSGYKLRRHMANDVVQLRAWRGAKFSVLLNRGETYVSFFVFVLVVCSSAVHWSACVDQSVYWTRPKFV